jgi:calcium/calmodulin-dependent protein kinase I
MHSLNIVHRDIKPENILLKEKKNYTDIVIADFGFSTFLFNNKNIIYKRCGTPGYVSPEILRYNVN